MLLKSLRHPLTHQIMRFAIVGTLAALVNLIVVWWLVENTALTPLKANIIAFFLAFSVSVTGHQRYTFPQKNLNRQQTVKNALRFLTVALISLGLSEAIFYLFLSWMPRDYLLDLFLTLLIAPCFTFILSKFWAFSS